MTVQVIYDNRVNIDDKERLIKEFERVGVSHYTFWDAVIDKKTTWDSIAQSHKNIVYWAKEQELNEVCIAEQDLFFPSPNGWNYFLENKPKEFDVYIGGNYLFDNRVEYKPPLVKVNAWTGNQLIIISERYYDRWLATPEGQHIDTAQDGKGEFYCCFPYPALQIPSRSANNGWQMLNYNAMLDLHNKDIPTGMIYQ